jgi:hypothetical protein
MGYQIELVNSARRHFRAAEELHCTSSAGAQPGCRAVAGYLYGLAGELAVKAMMISSGIVPSEGAPRREDPFYAHFPTLKHHLKDVLRGRRAQELRRVSEDDSLFQNWDTKMRYAPTQDIEERWVSAWRSSAKDLVERMELP